MLCHLCTPQWVSLSRPSWCEVFLEWVKVLALKRECPAWTSSGRRQESLYVAVWRGQRSYCIYWEKNGFTRALNGPVTGHWAERYVGTGRTKDEQQAPACLKQGWGQQPYRWKRTCVQAVASRAGGRHWLIWNCVIPSPRLEPHLSRSTLWSRSQWQLAGAATELSCRAITPMPCTAAACGLPLVYHKGGGFQLCFPEGGKAVLLWSGKRGMCWGQSWILLEELPELGTLLWEVLESLCKRQARCLLQGAELTGIHQTVCEGTVCLFIRSSCWLLLKLEFMTLS